ncbi:hypothetical protein [uncultured Tenacibaculum sp.]|uniref:hypothetical protein n=1 Tax=uncultured Tenacibaculum sp. TaxID=174713 RepID=UPI00260379C8|nr:hypothetical protein [uncultured Tenacibaculum sp.]
MKFIELDCKEEIERLFKEFKNNQSVNLDYFIKSEYIKINEDPDIPLSSTYDENSIENIEIKRKFEEAAHFLSLYNLIQLSYSPSSSTAERTNKFYDAAIFKSFKEWLNFVNEKAQRESSLLKSNIASNYVTVAFSILTFCALTIQIILSYNNDTPKELDKLNGKYNVLIEHNIKQLQANDSLFEFFNTQIDSLKQEIKILKVAK